MATALIIVDVQRDFLPGGALGVDGGFDIIGPILQLTDRVDYVACTRDAHPQHTSHFDQWPVHCVDGTPGAELHPAIKGLNGPIFNKGTQPGEDAYSGFDGTDLREWLSDRGVDVVLVVGLALDYCVKATALDAKAAGFSTTVLLDATRAVGDDIPAIGELLAAGVEVL